MGDAMGLSRWFCLVLAGLVPLGLSACSTGTSTGGSPSGGGTTVTVTMGTVPWVAVQDGSDAWQALSGTSFTVRDSAGKYGVAWVCPAAGFSPTRVQVVQTTVSEATAVRTICPDAGVSSGQYTVSGTASGIPKGDIAVIIASGVSSANSPAEVTAPGGAYAVPADPGTNAVLAFDLDGSNNPGNMVLMRNVSVSSDVTNLNVDMTSGKAFGKGMLALANLPSGELGSGGVWFGPSGDGYVEMAGDPGSFPLVPSALVKSGDVFVTFGSGTDSSGAFQQVVAASSSLTATTTMTLPAVAPGDLAFKMAGGKGTASWGSLSFAAGGSTVYCASVSPNSGSGALWAAVVTTGWLGSATSYTFPSFSAITGWDSAWDFSTNPAAASLWGAHGNVAFGKALAGCVGSSPGLLALPAGSLEDVSGRNLIGPF